MARLAGLAVDGYVEARLCRGYAPTSMAETIRFRRMVGMPGSTHPPHFPAVGPAVSGTRSGTKSAGQAWGDTGYQENQ